MNYHKFLTILFVSFALFACHSTARLDPDNQALTSQPKEVDFKKDVGNVYLWGGKVLAINNKESTTEITVLSYPLDRHEKPKLGETSSGRYIIEYQGFLEPTDYDNGKLITSLGKLTEVRRGKINDVDYNFPVLRSNQLVSKGNENDKRIRLPISIGIGVGL